MLSILLAEWEGARHQFNKDILSKNNMSNRLHALMFRGRFEGRNLCNKAMDESLDVAFEAAVGEVAPIQITLVEPTSIKVFEYEVHSKDVPVLTREDFFL